MMRAPARRSRPLVTDEDRIRRRDAKLWSREKAAAKARNEKEIPCRCKQCHGNFAFSVRQVEGHLIAFGRDPWFRSMTGHADPDSSDDEWGDVLIAQVSDCTCNHDVAPWTSQTSTSTCPTCEKERLQHGYRPTGYRTNNPRSSDGDQTNSHVAHSINVPETRFDDMIRDLLQEVDNPIAAEEDAVREKLQGGLGDPQSKLYKRAFEIVCEGSNQTVLDFAVTFINICAEHRCPRKAQDALLSLFHTRTLPEGNKIPPNLYHAELLIQQIGLTCEVIDACPRGCVLFRKQYSDRLKCPKCKSHRYNKGRAVNRVRYFPLIPRLLRMFKCPSISKLLTWAGEHKSSGRLVHHAAESKQWKRMDDLYGDFAAEMRNMRFGLLLDGIQPFTNKHSLWPIMLANYNLPPWLTTKRFFVMLSILIPGPKSIKHGNIDVYLEPLMEELQTLWKPGVAAYDYWGRFDSPRFTLHAMLIWTLGDYPALGYVSGLCTGGTLGCCVCGSAAPALVSRKLQKACHNNSRLWLPVNHPYRGRRFSHRFDGEEHRLAPGRQSVKTILEGARLKKKYELAGGKHRKKGDPYITHGVWRRSCLFDLEYWEHLPVKHCIDVMHQEKNVCQTLIGFLLGDKDTPAVRKDLQSRGIRPHLWIADGEMPEAPYVLTKRELKIFWSRIQGIKVSDGFGSNWETKVGIDPKTGKYQFVNMKSHDYHVLMQTLLPVVLRGLLSEEVRQAILQLCDVYRRICEKVYDPDKYEKLFRDTIITLCKLEMHFPPAFFNVMEHLLIHVVEELDWCGPVHTRWMYFGERILGHYANYVQNRSQIAGSISKAYLREEACGFSTEYMTNMQAYRERVWDAEEENYVFGEVPLGQSTAISLTVEESAAMHSYIVENHEILRPWREAYYEHIQGLDKEVIPTLVDWMEKEIGTHYQQHPEESLTDPDVFFLSRPLPFFAETYRHIRAYGYHYRIRDARSLRRSTYDSGIAGMFPTSVTEGSHETVEVEYVGELKRILHLPYSTRIPVILFEGTWVRPPDPTRPPSYRYDGDGLLEVNFKQVLPKSVDPYVLPKLVEQVFFMNHDKPSSPWRMVCRVEARSARLFDLQAREQEKMENGAPEVP